MNKFKNDHSFKIIVAVKQAILKIIRKDKNEREKSLNRINFKHELSIIIILIMLKRNNMKSYKIIKKFYLIKIIKKT